MTYKLTCPGCDAYTSTVFGAYAAGRPCPYCGASLAPAAAQYYRQLPDDERTAVANDESEPKYTPIEGLPTDVASYERYEVYVDSGRADDLFRAFCESLGTAIETSWKDTEDV